MKKPLSKKYSAHHTIPAYHQFTIAKYLLNKYTINNIYANLSGSLVVYGALRHPSTTIARSIGDAQRSRSRQRHSMTTIVKSPTECTLRSVLILWQA
jgi:hypothetical protein